MKWLPWLLLLVLLVFLACFHAEVAGGVGGAADYLARLWPPDLAYTPRLVPAIVATLRMSVLGASLAFLTAVPLSFFGCKRLVGNVALYSLARLVLSVLRATPVLVLGIMFVAALGLGPTAGVLAIWIHSTGSMGKLMSEALDSADRPVQEAASIDGANRWQAFVYVLLPMHANAFTSYYLYAVEGNFRDAVVLGIVGAGGIGLELITVVGQFQYERVGTVVLTIVAVALALDFASRALRSRLM